MEVARFGEALAKLLHVDRAEFLVGRDRQLERRAFQVIHEDFEIVRLHVGVLGRAAEKIIGMLHDELIERRGRRDEHRAGSPAAAAGAAGALPRGGDRAGIARHHAGVERADVDAQFQRVGRHHAADAAFAQAALDLAALAGKIAAAIAANRLGLPGLRRVRLLQIREQHFGVQAAIGEDDGLQFAREEFLRHARGFVQIAAADAEVAIDHRRIVEDEKLFGGGRAVFLDHASFALDQLRGQLAGIRDRRRAADELRPRAVEFARSRASRRSTLARWLPNTPR